MDRVKKIYYKGKEIVFVDYSNVKDEDEMIAIHRAHLDFVFKENKRYVYCADYTGSYTPTRYMKEVNNSLKNNKNLIIKGAFLGVTGAKNIILSGVIRLFGLNFKSFVDKTEALDYLVE
jgi:hypothetical protein